jgi:thymidine phosphorylase
MDIIEKLQAFIQANDNDKDILIAKEKDRLTLELYSLLIKAEKKGYLEGIEDFKIK